MRLNLGFDPVYHLKNKLTNELSCVVIFFFIVHNFHELCMFFGLNTSCVKFFTGVVFMTFVPRSCTFGYCEWY